ncbi:putative zinc finger protein 804A [Scophthalmus maximus]|uniref:Putative zinc finger protein 804A n=1 Tax=Scophthalmus maximus TaxID=52904 RepID=A0A2U9CDP0_SCOMX|nr:putative zinc finger protein 804A [Scophthalmus maximus]
MFRSTTVAVDPANQTRPRFEQNWVDIHSGAAALGTKPQTPLIRPFLPLDPALETRLLSNTQWMYNQMDANNTATAAPAAESCMLGKAHLDYSDLTVAPMTPTTATNNNMNTDNTDTATTTRHFNKIAWAHNQLNNTITPNNIPTTVTANGAAFNKTTTSSFSANTAAIPATTGISVDTSRAARGASGARCGPGRVRPVSFSLPKRSCVLLHQSAAVFIQAGRGSGSSGKPDGVAAQERAKDPGVKVADQQLKSPVSVGVVAADHLDTGNQCSVEGNTAIQHSEAGASASTETGPAGLSGTGAQVSLCDRVVIGADDSDDSGTGAQVSRESGTGALNNGITGQICDSLNTTQASVSGDSEALTHGDVDNPTESESTQELKDSLCPAANQPEKSISGILNDTKESSAQTQVKESNASPSVGPKEATPLAPSRPKEPFCPVLSRDGGRVLLWPSEMVRYTKTSPSISYSVNPLLYDFRAHNRAGQRGEDEKRGLEEGRGRIKPSVIKQPGCQQRKDDMEGGGGVKIDEREEEDEGGQAGNPMELVAHCSGGDAAPDRSGCRDENAFKFGAGTAGKRKSELPEAEAAPRKRRKRGRRQARRVAGVGFTSDLGVHDPTGDLTEELELDSNETAGLCRDTDCRCLCRTRHVTSDGEGTLSCNADDNCCRCGDSDGSAANDGRGHGGEEKRRSELPVSDCHTCNTPSDRCQCGGKSDGDRKHNDPLICVAADDKNKV